MSGKHVAILDVDGVLADFVGLALEFTPHKREDVVMWNFIEHLLSSVERQHLSRRLEQPETWATMGVLPGARDFVTGLRKLQYEVYFATAPWLPCVGWEHARRGWLKQHFDADPEHMISCTDKGLLKGDFFVDDKPENVRDFGRTGFLLDAPYNRTGLGAFFSPEGWPRKRVLNLDEALVRAKEIAYRIEVSAY